jgi:thioredoxin reductase (NADPH)
MVEVWDAIVIGAGPAGLSAALYLARFRRSTLVLHDGASRAARIPLTHNVPGYLEGVAGEDLLANMTSHAARYGAVVTTAHVARAEICAHGFALHADDGRSWRCRALVLATGVALNEIELDIGEHESAICEGVVRYCPICDGYEHIGQRIAVIGCDQQGAGEALFLRQYSDSVTLIPKDYTELGAATLQKLSREGVHVIETPVERIVQGRDCIRLRLKGESEPLRFDVIYPSLGLRPRARLAVDLGLALDENGNLDQSSIFKTSRPGLYAAGDIVAGLDQISVAMGHGAIAATRAHNWLREADGQTLKG